MLNTVSDMLKKVFSITNLLAGVCFFSVMVLVLMNIIMRNVFKMPIMGTVEIVGLLIATGLGLAMANVEMNDGNIGLDMDLPWSRKVGKSIEITTFIISLVFWAIVVWQIFIYAHASYVNGRVTPTTSIPIYPFIFILGFNVLCLCAALAYKLIRAIIDASAMFNESAGGKEGNA